MLADDRLIAMALLAPWLGEQLRSAVRSCTRPPAWAESSPTRSSKGVPQPVARRAEAGSAAPRTAASKPSHEARVELMEDVYSHDEAGGRAQLQRLLLDSFRRVLPSMPKVHEQLEELLCTEVSSACSPT